MLRTGQITPAADVYGFSMLLCEMLVAPVSVDPKPDEDVMSLGRRPKVTLRVLVLCVVLCACSLVLSVNVSL